jgi:hypothetical protein
MEPEPTVEINSHPPSAVAAYAVGVDDDGDWSREDDGAAGSEPMPTETEVANPAPERMISLAVFNNLL